MANYNPNRKFIPHKWYLVDTIIKYQPKAYMRDFDSAEDVERFINSTLGGSLRWGCAKGEDAIRNKLVFRNKQEDLPKIVKYDYPPECITNQDKKNFRTKLRLDNRNNAKKTKKRKYQIRKSGSNCFESSGRCLCDCCI